MMNRLCNWALPLGLAVLVTSGCAESKPDGPPRFETAGRVTFNGEPVRSAVVSFINRSMRISRGARTDDDGRFRVVASSGNGLPAGDYKVTVKDAPKGDFGEPDFNRRDIPKKFWKEATTDLAVTVTEGLAEISLDLGS